MKDREITLLSLRPVHPRGQPTEIHLNILLAYLNDKPVVSTQLTRRQVIQLIKECVVALEVTEGAK